VSADTFILLEPLSIHRVYCGVVVKSWRANFSGLLAHMHVGMVNMSLGVVKIVKFVKES
jgi:hypothetical protein